MSCGQAAIAWLEAYGVDTVFGIPGVHTLEFYRGLAGSRIRHIGVRHEQGAGFMADGYARATGRPGVCVLITGPGVTNAATPMGQAFSDSVPMLVLSSVNATRDLGRGRGRLHEITSQQAVIAPLTAFSRTVLEPNDLGAAMADAFAVFEAARPRPVHIEIPLDVLTMPAVGAAPQRRPVARRPQPDARQVAEAARLLAAADRPLVIAGGGALEAGAALTAIIERLGAVFIPTTAAKGLVSDDHPRSLGSSLSLDATQALVAKADVILAAGTELAETDSWIDRLPLNGALIRVDIDADALARDYPAKVALHADARASLEAIVAALGPGGAQGWDARAIAADAREANGRSMAPLQRRHAKLLDAIRQVLPDDGIVSSDMTQIAYTGCYHYRCRRPRTWFHPLGFGTLGYGLPAAIGAKLGAPDRAVMAVAGDAGFLFTVQELGTAVECGLPLPILLWNNDALGQIADDMVRRHIPEIGVKPRNPDYLALARSFGCLAVAPSSLAAFKSALSSALGADRPTLIEVRQDAPYLV